MTKRKAKPEHIKRYHEITIEIVKDKMELIKIKREIRKIDKQIEKIELLIESKTTT